MKEYLVKDCKHGYFTVKATDKQDDWIEILEDAEIALFFEKNQDKLVFYKNGGQSHASIDTGFNWKHDSLWTMEELLDENHSKNGVSFKHTVVWQRKATSFLIEYLNPADWSLHMVDVDNDAAGEDWIKVPEGAEWAKLWDDGCKYKSVIEFYRGYNEFFSETKQEWMRGNDQSTNKLGQPATIVWDRRHTQPEELPFVDDEPKHQHYFKDFSDCKKVDVYRVLDRFNVVHPCQQHIAKKALCAGNRGHKDLLRDIQDIIDTAERWKEMLLEDSCDGEG